MQTKKFRALAYVGLVAIEAISAAVEAVEKRLVAAVVAAPNKAAIDPASVLDVGAGIRRDLKVETCLDLSWLLPAEEPKEEKGKK